ncbi:MAG: hypothetical protein AAF318_18300 [Pseudomonadota bacterium]
MGATLVDVAWLYGAVGLGVAALFLVFGVGRVMESARGAFLFRPLLVPGIMLLWPVVLWRWAALERGARVDLRAHRPPLRAQAVLAAVLAVVVPLVLGVALIARQDGPAEAPAIRLDTPS